MISHLRNGLKGRRPYPKLYRHRPYDRPDRPETIRFGFPMTAKTRPKVIDEIAVWVNEKLLLWMPPGLLAECLTFVRRETRPSPRAADGCNDDRVMAWAIALQMYEEYGEHEHDRKKVTIAKARSKKPQKLYPWSY